MAARRNDIRPDASAQPVATTATAATLAADAAREPRRWIRILVLLAAIAIPQFVLIGPSLVGQKLLLPLDHLADKTNYLPRPADGTPPPVPVDGALSDLVFQTEVHRRLVVDEVRSGRIPLWNPYNYCGHPLLAANHTQVFSPYRILDYAWPSPVAIAWGSLLRSLVAGVGVYLLLRRAMGLGWIAAVAGGAFFPLSSAMVITAGYPGAAVISFLPWVIWAADRCVVRPSGRSAAGLAIATACALLCGHAAFAGHVLLASGAYFFFRLGMAVGARNLLSRSALAPVAAAIAGITIGLLLSLPQTLPTIDYLRSSLRIAQRQAGDAETRTAGFSAFTQMVLPYIYGSTHRSTVYIGVEGSRIEGAAVGYAGLFVALVLMPIGWADRSRRRWMIFWSALAFLAAVPAAGVPVVEWLFRIPPVSLLRNNRLVFVTGFSVVMMASIGVNVLLTQPQALRQWGARSAMALAGLVAVVLSVWCIVQEVNYPITPTGMETNPFVVLWPDRWVSASLQLATDEELATWYGLMYRNGALVAGCAAAALTVVFALFSVRATPASANARRRTAAIPALLTIVAAVELIASAAGVNVQADPSLYYPRLAWMDRVLAEPGRLCGVDCLPANLALAHRIADIRGYDAADPVPTVELIRLAQDPAKQNVSPPYAVTRILSVNAANPGPVANLLGVRYIVGRGPPPPGLPLAFVGDDYWLIVNDRALPRVTIPKQIELIADKAERLRRLASSAHDPASLAFVETPDPTCVAAEGLAAISGEQPGRMVIDASLSRGGLIRVSESWNAGWQATWNGDSVPIVRIDHALIGVVAPAGKGTLELRYAPGSFFWGLALAAVAGIAMLLLAFFWRNTTHELT
ncbi:glycosyltransferase family protein [Humisphaera borealis]|uniref:YfhO family protein n=1 Tax=Humisphaera borealis TaxID=2807512 RepID=A0A7M2WS82_9BACT|nr:hypothetical protein [Humisphaera borealis]QOV87651.1 hypothetical protein IPV69_15300 [Humisphaera borealis]